MKKYIGCLLCFWGFTNVLFSQVDYQSKFQKILGDDLLKNSEAGISVYDLTSDSLLYSYQSNKRYRPASVEKLITTITAVARLGGQHEFNTSLAVDGEVKNDTLHGNLFVIGGFDPDFMMDEMNQLAKQVESKNIKHITGKIYSDVSMVDSTLYYGSGWSWDDALYDFQPVLSPLMFHKGWVTVTAYPASKKGEPASINIYPESSYNEVENNAITDYKKHFSVTRDAAHVQSKFIVSGGVSSRQVRTITVADSKTFFVRTFVDHLREKGVDSVAYGGDRVTPVSSDTIFSVGHTLAEVIHRALKVSDNLNAESIFYHLAASGKCGKYADATDGREVINKFIDELGMDHKDYNIVDGSGVSLYDYISPDLLIRFLKYAYNNKILREVIYPSLPVAGVDGTLKNRMKNGNVYSNVHAKTGTVTGVSSLAGYLQTVQGHMLAFVIINQNNLNERRAHQFQDRICRMLTE